MGEQSKIEWTHHTFNPWWGCFKVSDGCKHCYADTLAKRYGHNVWGPAKSTSRRMMSENYWKQPLKWNASAAKRGVRERVFCASMADVFEDHPDVVEARVRLLGLILATPHLDWLLLTKRPENIKPILQAIPISGGETAWDMWNEFTNVRTGTSVENQEQANKRIPELIKVGGQHFLSCEPLLGEVMLARQWLPHLHWVIVGGESGHGARPMHPDWARSLRDQCNEAGVAFFFKQWGEQLPLQLADEASWYRESQLVDGDGVTWARVGKGAAGRLLDGREWSEFPEVEYASS